MIEIGFLVSGIMGLVVGTEIAVTHGAVLARHYKLSDLFIGIVFFAIATDLPELVVAIDAGMRNLEGQQVSGLVLGNSLGSCFAQIGLTLGLLGLRSRLKLSKGSCFFYGTLALGSLALLFLLSYFGQVTRLAGVVLIVSYFLYLGLLYRREVPPHKKENSNSSIRLWQSWLGVVGGLALVIFSSDLTITAIVYLANVLKIDQTLIAIVVLGAGTSLPELSLSLTALRKEKIDMAVGNIIGSNIFDTLLPIGASAAIHPLVVEPALTGFDLPALFFLTLVVFLFFLRSRGIGKLESVTIILIYLFYLLHKGLNGGV